MEILGWIVGAFIIYMIIFAIDIRRRYKQYEIILSEITIYLEGYGWHSFCNLVDKFYQQSLNKNKNDTIIGIIKMVLIDMILIKYHEKGFISWARNIDAITVEKDLNIFMEEVTDCGLYFAGLIAIAEEKFDEYNSKR